jgi:hypothetical protein
MHPLKLVIAAGLMILVVGCSTKGQVSEVIGAPASITVTNQFDKSILVLVSGGDDSYVSSEVFAESLVTTLNDIELFKSASLTQDGGYNLSVTILGMVRSFFGHESYVTSLWTLSTSEGEELWSETIESTGESNTFAGVSRMRESAERAAKATIELGVTKLSTLDL